MCAREWKETLQQCSIMLINIPSGNIIKINHTIKTIGDVTCKDFYWHLINTDHHTPIAEQILSAHYPIFKDASANVWHRIFNLPLQTVRNTKTQTFQYRIIQNNIPYKRCIHNIKIKSNL